MQTIDKFLLSISVLTVLVCISCSEETARFDIEKKSTTLFTLVDTSQSHILFSNTLPEDRVKNVIMFEYYYQGAGVATGDLNNDGWVDAYFSGNLSKDRIYMNTGDMAFRDMTPTSGINTQVGWNCGVTFADVNADGLLDIYVCRGGEFQERLRSNLLYINRGDFNFSEEAAQYGLNDAGHSMHSAFFDFDKDGDLDVYVTNTPRPVSPVIKVAFADKASYGPTYSDKLYINDGKGHFDPVIEEAGLVYENGYGLGIAIGDYNNDGWEDIYVANDYDAPDLLYINQHDGTFRESLSDYMRHTSNNSMGCAMADFNNDGLDDIVVLDMLSEDYKRSKILMSTMNVKRFWNVVETGGFFQYMRNTLQVNTGRNSFSEIAQFSGIDKTDWSWSPLVGDYDNDGFQDIIVTNGIVRDITNRDFELYTAEQAKLGDKAEKDILNVLRHMPSNKLPNYAFRNKGNLAFEKVADTWQLDILGFSTGAATADFDNDGDLDVLINNTNDPASLFRNNSRNAWLAVRLKGSELNPFAIGARVFVNDGTSVQNRLVQSQSGYLSAGETRSYFGLKGFGGRATITVIWPDGNETIVNDVGINREIVIEYDQGLPKTSYYTQNQNKPDEDATWVKEINPEDCGLGFIHSENEFDDFEFEILLPYKTSMYGPKMTTGDINGDGRDDILIGGASGMAITCFTSNPDGRYSKVMHAAFEMDRVCEDAELLLFDFDQDGDLDLYAVSGGNEFPAGSENYDDRIYINDGTGTFTKGRLGETFAESGSCVASADYDGDGDEDLFVGARLIPRNYGMAPTSRLLENREGMLVDVTEQKAAMLNGIGMVTDAVWSDVDEDGDPDLVLAGEWMKLTFLQNDGSVFTDITGDVLDMDYTGFWNALIATDLNADGRDDFVVGNFGLNTKYKASIEFPLNLFVSDFDNNGSNDIVLSKYVDDKLFPLRGRECLSWQMPYISEKYPSYAQFADSDMEEIYGRQNLEKALHRTINTLASGILLSQPGGGYVFKALPDEVQWSPVFGLLSADFNSDGNPEIVAVGNFRAPEVETGQFDAGNGALLTAHSQGVLTFVPWDQSGFFCPGEARDIGLVKDHQGQPAMIVVANNSGKLQVFSL